MKSNEMVSDNIHWELALHLVDNLLHLIENFIGGPLVWDFSSISVLMLLTMTAQCTQYSEHRPTAWLSGGI